MMPIAVEPSLSLEVKLLSGLFAVGLTLVHLFAGQLQFLETLPRSRWLSLASGISVAYVFVHVLPELNAAQQGFTLQPIGGLAFLEHHVYLLALIGLVAFYGLERSAKLSQLQNRRAGKSEMTTVSVFWIHIASFAIYNALIGYLLVHREEPEFFNLMLFFIAMAMHFIVNDFGLRENHKWPYDRVGRWVLAGAVLIGWAIGTHLRIHQVPMTILFAFLAGGIVLNILKEELPEERESRFGAFAFGAAAYTILLLLAE
jgi:hypothetical protein